MTSTGTKPISVSVALVALLLMTGGCAFEGDSAPLRLITGGEGPPRMLDAPTAVAVYAADDAAETMIMLSDLPPAEWRADTVDSGQLVHLDLLWLPKPGATPIDASATNVSIRYVIFAGGEMGVYGGAGFVQPRGEPGDDRWVLDVRDSDLRLLESTAGFVDPLGPATLVGRISAANDPASARWLRRAASQRVTDRLGRTRYVGR